MFSNPLILKEVCVFECVCVDIDICVCVSESMCVCVCVCVDVCGCVWMSMNLYMIIVSETHQFALNFSMYIFKLVRNGL